MHTSMCEKKFLAVPIPLFHSWSFRRVQGLLQPQPSERSVEQPRFGVARSGERADFPSPRHSGHACGWPAGEHQSGAARQFGNAPQRPNGDSGDLTSCRGDRAARPAAEGLDGRAEETAHCSAAPTPPPGAERPMHSTRAQDAAEPRIADFRRSPQAWIPRDWRTRSRNGW